MNNKEKLAEQIMGQELTTVQDVNGGISSSNFAISTLDGSKAFLTIYENRKDWWKVGKEKAIQGYANEANFPIARLQKSGNVEFESRQIAFLVKEFIEGKDLDTLLREAQGLPQTSWESLLYELGDALARIHSVEISSGYGLIKNRGVEKPKKNWVSFMDASFREIEVNQAGFNQQHIADISQRDVMTLIEDVKSFFANKRKFLVNTSTPRLTHNDARLANFIGTTTLLDTPQMHLAATVDFEWAFAGDPGIDFIQIENWLEFAPYQERFISASPAFLNGYESLAKLPNNLESRRDNYHLLRSLSFISAIFSLPEKVGSPIDGYVKQHFEMAKKVMAGKSTIRPLTKG